MTSLMKHIRYIKEVILYTDPRIAVLLISISNLYWAAILFLPGDVLYKPFYRGLSDITLNENIWGTVFLLMALVRIYRLLKEEERSESKFYQTFDYITRLVSCFVTTYIFITAAAQPASPPVAGDTLVLLLLAWWDFFRYDKISYRTMYLRDIKREE